VCWNPLESSSASVSGYGLLLVGRLEFVSGNCERSTRVYIADDEDIRLSGLMQVNDGLYAEVPLRCASGPIARRWIVPKCVGKLYECKNGSECWKIATRGPVGRIL
jgi:hypothetical protein